MNDVTSGIGIGMVTLEAKVLGIGCWAWYRSNPTFHIFAAGNRKHFKCGMCPPTDDKPSLKWALSRHVTYFKFLVPKISLERLKLETSNLVCTLIIASPSLLTTNSLWKGHGRFHV